MRTCSRLTKAGRPCGRYPVVWQGITSLADPQACRNHLAAAELAVLEAHREAEEAARDRVLESDPACWSWPWPVPAGED